MAWAAAIERSDGPTALLFTGQNVPFRKREPAQIAAIRGGGYVLADWTPAADDTRAAVVGLDRSGESAPAGALFEHFGITANAVAAAVRQVLG